MRAAGLVAIVALVACAQSGCTREKAAPAGNATPIRIAYSTDDGILFNVHVGMILQRTDILARNRLKGVIATSQRIGDAYALAESGEADVALLTGGTTNLLMVQRPGRLAVVTSLGLIGRRSHGLVLKDSPIRAPKDLVGKTVVTINGLRMHRHRNGWLERGGVERNQINWTAQYLYGSELEQALRTGSVDMAATWSPFLEDLIDRGVAREIDWPCDTPQGCGIPSYVLMSRQFLSEHPQAAADFLVALKQAVVYLADHKQEVNGWVSEAEHVPAALIDRILSEHNRLYRNVHSLSDFSLAEFPEEAARIEKSAKQWLDDGALDEKRDAGESPTAEPGRKLDVAQWIDLTPAKAAEAKLAAARTP